MSVARLTESPSFDVMSRPPLKMSLQEKINMERVDELYPRDQPMYTLGGVGNHKQIAPHQFEG